MRPPADGRSTPSRSTSVSERIEPAYVPGTAADLRWVDGSKEKGIDFDAMDPMYVVEPGVRYTYRLSEAALASVENSTLPEDVKVYFRHDIVINAQNEGRRACLIGWDLAKADLETATSAWVVKWIRPYTDLAALKTVMAAMVTLNVRRKENPTMFTTDMNVFVDDASRNGLPSWSP